MVINDKREKIIKYIVFAVNSLLFGFAYILFHRNYMSASGSSGELFSLLRTIVFIGLSVCMFLMFFICSYGKQQKKYEIFAEKLGAHPLFTTVLITAIFRIWYLSHFNNYVLYYDTKTYTNYPYNIFLGETDIFRTPGYPYFLKFIHYITGNFENNIDFYESVSFVQSIMSLASIVILYLAGRKLFSNKYILSLACLTYGIAPSVFNWDIITLTESFSLFCTVVLIYIVFSYLAKPTAIKSVVLGLYAFGMIMIRPTFVYLLAVLGVFFVARFIFNCKERKKAIAGIISVVMSVALFFGYCGLNYKNYDYFKVSSVSNTVNNLYIVMAYGWSYNEDYPEISEHLERQMEFFEGGNWISDIVEPLPDYYSYSEIDAYVTDCIDKHKSEYYKYTAEKFLSLANEKIAIQYTVFHEYGGLFEDFAKAFVKVSFPFSFLDCIVLVIAGVLFSVIVLIKKKRICWHIIGLCAIIFSHIFVSVYGSMAEFSRLSSMVIPAVVLLVFYMIDYAVKAVRKRKALCLNDNNSTLIQVREILESDNKILKGE